MSPGLAPGRPSSAAAGTTAPAATSRRRGRAGRDVLVGLASIAYRRRATALHAARPAVAAVYCAALGALTLAISNPLLLGATLISVLAVGTLTGALPSQRRAMVVALPLAVLVLLVNVLVSHHGLTVLLRLGEWPVVGRVDVTAESLAAGGVLALRVIVVILVGVLAAVTVDPDRLLTAARRWWPAGALSSALALRVVPVLARDGARLADARRCRPDGVPGAHDDRRARLLVLRAVTASVLDRASDLAATLELRGHGLRHRPTRVRPPWSRHDRAFLGSTLVLVGVAAVALVSGAGRLTTDPRLETPDGALPLVLAALVPLAALAPLLNRTGTSA
ncbi:MAG: energy-coupling factor transporter transmembrane protein EcfT [Patulibacter sp.]|nr:energy-coupling factor transporter transmembrane protein EcfT [Patulibacter sp.]